MSVDLRDAIWGAKLPSNEKFLALALIKFAKPDGSSIFPSQQTLASMTSWHVRHVRRVLKSLQDSGIIEPVRGVGGGNTTVHYQFHAERLTPDIPDTTPDILNTDPGYIVQVPRTLGAYDPAIVTSQRTSHQIQPVEDDLKRRQRLIGMLKMEQAERQRKSALYPLT